MGDQIEARKTQPVAIPDDDLVPVSGAGTTVWRCLVCTCWQSTTQSETDRHKRENPTHVVYEAII